MRKFNLKKGFYFLKILSDLALILTTSFKVKSSYATAGDFVYFRFFVSTAFYLLPKIHFQFLRLSLHYLLHFAFSL